MMRRVKWAGNYYSEQGSLPSRHKSEKLAGTRNTTGKTPIIQGAIYTAMKSLSG